MQEDNLRYKECSHCGTINDLDQEECVKCHQNPFLEQRFSAEDIVRRLETGELSPKKLNLKHWGPICQILQGSP